MTAYEDDGLSLQTILVLVVAVAMIWFIYRHNQKLQAACEARGGVFVMGHGTGAACVKPQ